jgi:hypothetical protein
MTQYGYVGHGTTLYASGSEADGFYCHEITTIHEDGEDWDTIAFIPEGNGDEEIVRVLGSAFTNQIKLEEIGRLVRTTLTISPETKALCNHIIDIIERETQ